MRMLQRRFSRAAIALACSAAPSIVWAQTFTWTTPTNASFSVGPWSPSTPSWGGGVATVLRFNPGAPYTATNDLGAPFAMNGLIVNSSTSGNPITLANDVGNQLSLVANGPT